MVCDGRTVVLLTLSCVSCGGGRIRSLVVLRSCASLRRNPAVTSHRVLGFQSTCAYWPANIRRSLTVPISLTFADEVAGGRTVPSSGTVYALLPFLVVCCPWP